jgi:hypothetical protein
LLVKTINSGTKFEHCLFLRIKGVPTFEPKNHKLNINFRLNNILKMESHLETSRRSKSEIEHTDLFLKIHSLNEKNIEKNNHRVNRSFTTMGRPINTSAKLKISNENTRNGLVPIQFYWEDSKRNIETNGQKDGNLKTIIDLRKYQILLF